MADSDGASDLVTVLRGLQAVADHGADVVNLSLSSGSPLPYQLDPLTIALEALWAHGTTVVVPAGNDGKDGRRSITSPGIDPVLITVGGLDEAGTASARTTSSRRWSGQGPAPQGVQKPDLVAPGAHVVSTAAVGSRVWTDNPASRVEGAYVKGSGTSFATAVASGAAAPLLACVPASHPDVVKALLTRTAYKVSGSPVERRARGPGRGGRAQREAAQGPGQRRALPRRPGLAALVDALCAAPTPLPGSGPSARGAAVGRPPVGGEQLGGPAVGGEQLGREDWAARQLGRPAVGGAPGPTLVGPPVVGRHWSARQWSARQWSARQWSATDWA